jgi:hypothetical protein
MLRRRRLDRHQKLDDVAKLFLVGEISDVEPEDRTRPGIGDESAGTLARPHQTVMLQPPHGLAHDRAADAMGQAELLFGRQALAGLKPTRGRT